jgi:hypothetical protein
MVVSLRLVIISGWAAVAAAIVFLPPLNPATGGLSELIRRDRLISDSITSVFADLGPVAAAIVVVTLILLVLFLRSLLAPVYPLVPALVALFGRLGMWPGYRREPHVRVNPLVSDRRANVG